jgi:hypothetical protein
MKDTGTVQILWARKWVIAPKSGAGRPPEATCRNERIAHQLVLNVVNSRNIEVVEDVETFY